MKEALLIPPCWRVIGMEALMGNRRLRALSVPHTIGRIGFGAFQGCSRLGYVELREGLEEIGPFAFAETGLRTLELPDTLRVIEHSAFAEADLEEVMVPGSVASVREFTFEKNENLHTVVLEEGVREICANAFRDCTRLRQVQIPDTVTRIDPSAFEGCVALETVAASEKWKERYPDLLLNCLDQSTPAWPEC